MRKYIALFLALALMTLAVLVVKHCGKELLTGKVEGQTAAAE